LGCDWSLNVTLRVTLLCGMTQSLSGSVVRPEERQLLTLGSNCHLFMLQALNSPQDVILLISQAIQPTQAAGFVRLLMPHSSTARYARPNAQMTRSVRKNAFSPWTRWCVRSLLPALTAYGSSKRVHVSALARASATASLAVSAACLSLRPSRLLHG
jgi:hypothetical protein